MGVRSRSDQADHPLSAGNIVALFQGVGYRLDGKALLFGAAQCRVIAGNADGRLSRGQPIHQLPMISTQSQLHIAIQFAHEFQTQEVIHVEVPKNIAGNAGNRRVIADNFSLPLWVYKIPPRLDFVRLRLLGVDGDVNASMPLKDERVTSLRIDKAMLSLEPF